ncbi:alcohol dehydrogenase-like protein [Cytobacillus oceanisediminis]|jgi:propanol-preferring alcohol dehydrogenase|uniref:Alcohol dehydrogenase-like protein n=1 Tax=Cytobacillus oceanisediminis TaxID=665099 RepID=A0A2V2ZWG6_9BACI|nr:alcohol dehydrogenase catalytic domain-containing protein [Cytobacillus oceanisediminis]PWW28405.1 alcohol dehydrogenase-like protein [Cytobacillus oceanisediminis]
MKAAVVHEFKENLAIENIKIPLVGCFSENQSLRHLPYRFACSPWRLAGKPTLPLISGHEGVGEIVEAGEGVTHLKAGDRGVFLGCIPLADNVNIA